MSAGTREKEGAERGHGAFSGSLPRTSGGSRACLRFALEESERRTLGEARWMGLGTADGEGGV